jgi:hypothetical protein
MASSSFITDLKIFVKPSTQMGAPRPTPNLSERIDDAGPKGERVQGHRTRRHLFAARCRK